MKKILFFLFSACMLIGCQVIKEEDRWIEIEAKEPVSRALITECTGFLCVNCPRAAEAAHQLLETYPDNLVVVEIHPKTNTFCQTKKPEYDYTCPEADSLYLWLGGTATTGFPTGSVNLVSGLVDYLDWPAQVLSAITKETLGKLQLSTPQIDGRNVTLSWHAEATSANEQSAGKEIELVTMLWLIEDSIVGPQMMPDGSQNMNYVHNHVLRGSVLPSIFGEKASYIINQPDNSMHPVVYTIPEMNNGQTIRMQHCAIVGVLADAKTMQVHDVQVVHLNNE